MKMRADEVLEFIKKSKTKFIEAYVPELGFVVRLHRPDALSRLYMAHEKEIEVKISDGGNYICIGNPKE